MRNMFRLSPLSLQLRDDYKESRHFTVNSCRRTRKHLRHQASKTIRTAAKKLVAQEINNE